MGIDNLTSTITGKTTPGSIHLTHRAVYHGQYSGDETLQIHKRIEVINNYVYIDGVNTGINVKGDTGPTGESAYQSYLKYCEKIGIEPLSESDWVKSIDTVMYVTIGGEQSDWDQADIEKLSFIKNKPLKITKTIDPETGGENYEVEFV